MCEHNKREHVEETRGGKIGPYVQSSTWAWQNSSVPDRSCLVYPRFDCPTLFFFMLLWAEPRLFATGWVVALKGQ